MRRTARRALRSRLARSARPLDAVRFERPTVVLAPHPDDETLGCGGLVARLSDHGARVTIVVLTDGAMSHGTDDREHLVTTRRREATAAAGVLGVADERMHFLDHPDGELARFVDAAGDALAELLDDRRDAQVVLPHPAEPNRDHAATYRAGRRAAELLGCRFDALLYGVWIWDQWPWTNPLAPPRGRHGRRQLIETAVRGRFGMANARWFDTIVELGAARERKLQALRCHASQVDPQHGGADRITLGDVAGGEWLDWLTGPNEFYRSARLGSGDAPEAEPS